MRITLVCGMLGAGKTTFIRNLLKDAAEKTVVLVNDFGTLGIDGEIISAGGIETVELPSGCVCCTLKFDLVTSINKIKEAYAPDHLVIEPSGVAAASGVLEALEAAGVGSAAVIGIVDATEFVEFHESGMCGRFFEDQITNSNVVLVNKSDLAGEDLTERSEGLIETLNPSALVFRTTNAIISEPLLDILSPLPSGERTSASSVEPAGVRGSDPQRGTLPLRTGKTHFRFQTLSIKLGDAASFASMADLFRHLAAGAFGKAVRAKALVQTDRGPYRFDLSSGRVDSILFERDVTESRIVIIGEGLDEGAIKAASKGRYP